MSTYMQSELEGNPEQAGSVNTEIRDALYNSLNLQVPKSDEEIRQIADELNNKDVMEATDAKLATGTATPENLQEEARDFQSAAPNPGRVVRQAKRQVSFADAPERREALEQKHQAERQLQNTNKSYALERLAKREAQLQMQYQDAIDNLVPGDNPISNGVKALVETGVTVSEWLDTNLIPGFYNELINIVDTVAPEKANFLSRLQPAERRKELTNLIRTLPADQSKELVDQVFQLARDKGGRILNGQNRVGELQLLETILNPLETEESVIAWDNLFAPLDVVFGAADIAALASRGTRELLTEFDEIKHLWEFSRGSVADRFSDYKQGSENLVRSVQENGGRGADNNPATDASQITGTLMLPKPARPGGPVGPTGGGPIDGPPGAGGIDDPGFQPHGKPYLDTFFVPVSDREAKKEAARDIVKKTYSNRLNDWVMETGDKSIDITARIGAGDGVGWQKREQAEAWAKSNLVDDNYSVVQDKTGNFQVERKHQFGFNLTDITTKFENPTLFGLGAGRSSRYSEDLNRAATQADINTSKELEINQQLTKTMRSLGGQQQKQLGDILIEGEAMHHNWTPEELFERGIKDPKVIQAYQESRQLIRKNLQIKNENAYQGLKADGYHGDINVDGGKAIVKEIDPSLVGSLGDKVKIVNITNNKKVKPSSININEHRVYRFFESTRNGYTYGIAPKGSSVNINPLPTQVLQDIPGWLPRDYKSPYFIRARIGKDEDGEDLLSRAWYTARSVKAAEKKISELKAQGVTDDIDWFEASSIAEEASGIPGIERLREQGLLYSSHRRPQALPDAEDAENMESVHESLERIVRNSAFDMGIGRFTQSVKHWFDKTYGPKLGFTLDLSRAPERPRKGELQPLFDEAMQVYNYMRLINGNGPGGLPSQVATFGRKVSKLLYNRNLNWAGDQLSGRDPQLINKTKSAAFHAFLATNFHKQIPLQASQAPLYLAFDGGAEYLMSGRLGVDATILTLGNDSFALGTFLDTKGLKWDYARELLDQFKDSGLSQMVDTHIMAAGTASDSRAAVSTPQGRAMAKGLQGIKKAGFDVGVNIDKMSAWLVSRNRFLKQNGRAKLDKEGLKKVAQDAESFTMNMNQTDPLWFDPSSALGAFMQFKSHPIKALNRTLGGTVGPVTDVASNYALKKGWTKKPFSLAKETGLSRTEQAKFGVAAMLFYGFTGFGMMEFIDNMDHQFNLNMPGEMKTSLEEGINGYLVNRLFRLADDPQRPDETDEEYDRRVSRVLFSKDFSPVSATTDMVGTGAEIGYKLLTFDWQDMHDFIPEPANIGFVGSMLDAFTFTWTLAGGVGITGDTAMVATKNFFSKFPVVSSAMKAHMALNTGYSHSTSGNPVAEATKGEALAAIWGLDSKEEFDLRRAQEFLYGPYEPLDREGFTEKVEGEVRNTLDWMLPLLRQMNDGEIDYSDAHKLIQEHNVAWATALEPEEYGIYRDKLAQEILRADDISAETIAESIARNIQTGRYPVTQSFRDMMNSVDFQDADVIRSGFTPEKRDETLNLLEKAFDFVAEPFTQDDE